VAEVQCIATMIHTSHNYDPYITQLWSIQHTTNSLCDTPSWHSNDTN